MTTARLWYQGARPKTLGAAISPVLVGTAAGSLDGPIDWPRAGAAAVVALALQVGVNFANDYSDGVRGTDAVQRAAGTQPCCYQGSYHLRPSRSPVGLVWRSIPLRP